MNFSHRKDAILWIRIAVARTKIKKYNIKIGTVAFSNRPDFNFGANSAFASSKQSRIQEFFLYTALIPINTGYFLIEII